MKVYLVKDDRDYIAIFSSEELAVQYMNADQSAYSVAEIDVNSLLIDRRIVAVKE